LKAGEVNAVFVEVLRGEEEENKWLKFDG